MAIAARWIRLHPPGMAALLARKNIRFTAHGNELQDGAVVEEGAS